MRERLVPSVAEKHAALLRSLLPRVRPSTAFAILGRSALKLRWPDNAHDSLCYFGGVRRRMSLGADIPARRLDRT